MISFLFLLLACPSTHPTAAEAKPYGPAFDEPTATISAAEWKLGDPLVEAPPPIPTEPPPPAVAPVGVTPATAAPTAPPSGAKAESDAAASSAASALGAGLIP